MQPFIHYRRSFYSHYGKKARSCALSCFVNGHTEPDFPSKQQCTRAKEHLLGWSSIDPTTYTNVQSIHELVHVAIAYDLMFPMLTEADSLTSATYIEHNA